MSRAMDSVSEKLRAQLNRTTGRDMRQAIPYLWRAPNLIQTTMMLGERRADLTMRRVWRARPGTRPSGCAARRITGSSSVARGGWATYTVSVANVGAGVADGVNVKIDGGTSDFT